MRYRILIQEDKKNYNLHKNILTKSLILAIINYSVVTKEKLWIKNRRKRCKNGNNTGETL